MRWYFGLFLFALTVGILWQTAPNSHRIRQLPPARPEDGPLERQLLTATFSDDVSAARRLLDLGATGRTNGPITPLYIAARRANLELVQLLLDHGVEPDASSLDGWTALMGVADRPHDEGNTGAEIVAQLLREGANPNATEEFGRTPLDFAMMRGNVNIARKLSDAGGRAGHLASITKSR
jgi:ankyrin repeat protein